MKRSTILIWGIALLILTLVLQIYVVATQYRYSKDDGAIINHAGMIRGNIQRIGKLALAGEAFTNEVDRVEALIENFRSESEGFKHQGYSDEFVADVARVEAIWATFRRDMDRYLADPNPETLRIFIEASENAWHEADRLVLQAQTYAEGKSIFYRTVLMVVGLSLAFVVVMGYLVDKYVRRELEYLATHDPLTTTWNRLAFMSIVEREVAHCLRYESTLSLFIIDLDHFKRINDTHGHQAGDRVLRDVSKIVRRTVRKSDYFFRVGGEEFALLLPNTSLDDARHLAERIRDRIARHSFVPVSQVTVSMGGTAYVKDEDVDSFNGRADLALYAAKDQGRNQVITV